MSALSAFRSLIGAALLAPGLAVANGTESGLPGAQALSAGTASVPLPAIASLPPVWLPMVSFPGAQAYYYYPIVQPGMMWPMPYPYPMPQATPPFVWLPVPLQTLSQQARPAAVDYGPVADTPVVELLPFEATPAAGLHPGAAPAGAAAADPVAVDYGPVAPTPVVNLVPVPSQAGGTKPRNRLRPASDPLRKPVAATPRQARPAAPAAPAGKRMCWTRGVVAPCP